MNLSPIPITCSLVSGRGASRTGDRGCRSDRCGRGTTGAGGGIGTGLRLCRMNSTSSTINRIRSTAPRIGTIRTQPVRNPYFCEQEVANSSRKRLASGGAANNGHGQGVVRGWIGRNVRIARRCEAGIEAARSRPARHRSVRYRHIPAERVVLLWVHQGRVSN